MLALKLEQHRIKGAVDNIQLLHVAILPPPLHSLHTTWSLTTQRYQRYTICSQASFEVGTKRQISSTRQNVD